MSKLTLYIVLAMLAGVLTGWACSAFVVDPALNATIAADLSICTEVFLRLISMIIAPLVLATMITGLAQLGSAGSIGRIFVRTLALFVFASLVSLCLGLSMASWLEPGHALHLDLPAGTSAHGAAVGDLGARQFVTHLVPRSLAEAMANNEILQVVVFALFVGVACAALGKKAQPLVSVVAALAEVMLKVTGYVMLAAPVAVFAAIAAAITLHGPAVLAVYARLVGSFYAMLALLWLALLVLALPALSSNVGRFLRTMREPVLLAFSTASSESAYPKTLLQLERFGASNRVASFVLPLGYSFNLVGSMAYCTFAVLFIAQAYGIEPTFAQKMTMLLVLMVMSKGLAGVPRASIAVLTAALPHFDLPAAGLLLVLPVDQFLDMGRTATNVFGNSVATVVVASWEGELRVQADES
ncbi:MAG TPA: dicarboxylate/amino acid:cation symporter [Steroidobacteraceae bacterium]|nr:dicarboxylate/amino acid:cation symporter [Steroidobacteraceae bacterium]